LRLGRQEVARRWGGRGGGLEAACSMVAVWRGGWAVSSLLLLLLLLLPLADTETCMT